jgi:ATP-dependent Clp protease, protease subunit
VGPGCDLPAYAHQHTQRLRRLHESVASACRHDVGTVARDMRVGRLLDADQARAYRLIDSTARP